MDQESGLNGKLSRDLEVDELLEMLQKGAPAFETAHSVFELGQTIEKLTTAMRHVAHRQATLEDQVRITADKLTKIVESLEKALQPKEPGSQRTCS